jgi:hypothetical protein
VGRRFLLAGVCGSTSTTTVLRVAADRSRVEPLEQLNGQHYTAADFHPTQPARLLRFWNNYRARSGVWLDCHAGKELARPLL